MNLFKNTKAAPIWNGFGINILNFNVLLHLQPMEQSEE
jgi:hypothetical protein